jgi:hypothetical protein
VQGSTGAMLVWATTVVSSKGEDRDVILKFFVIWRKTQTLLRGYIPSVYLRIWILGAGTLKLEMRRMPH